MTELGLRGTIVFDSHPAHSAPHPLRSQKANLEVITSPTNMDADTFLLEFLSSQGNIKNTILVTSDRAVASSAKSLGAAILEVKDFLELLHTKELHLRKPPEKPHLECRVQLKRLLHIFEEKYENDEI